MSNIIPNDTYIDLLKTMTSLSGLFSDSDVPYLYYRNAENLFCYAMNAKNLSRDDTAFDALLETANGEKIGVGLKTFICKGSSSLEKVAEFNQLASSFKSNDIDETIYRIATARNERILFAKRLYGIEDATYHLVSRRQNELRIFNENYDLVDLNNIKIKKDSKTTLKFSDGRHNYSYHYSKSTLFKEFHLPSHYQSIPINIISEPYQILLNLKNLLESQKMGIKQYPSIVLPLYSVRDNTVPLHSGLNQWNARGRPRSLDEVYIPIPKRIHTDFPDFFPARDKSFTLATPDGKTLVASVCQAGGKALMTNPNSALAVWLLRQLLNLKRGELATMERLELMDCDSVIITKINENEFRIDKAKFGAYREFCSEK